MGAYPFNSNKQFLRYSATENNIHVYELHSSGSLTPNPHDWKLVVSIGPNEVYNSLKVFGTLIDGIILNNLEENLCNSHLMINPEGFRYLDTTEIVGPTFNVQYYKLNDLFCWSEYVDLPSDITFETSWNRCGIQTGEPLLDHQQRSEDLNEKNERLKCVEDELESTRKLYAIAECELKKKQDELYDAKNRLFQYEGRLEDKDKKLEKLREKLSELQNNNKMQNEESAAAKSELKTADQELKMKQNELWEANNKIFQYETRLEDKEKKIEKLREKLASTQAKLEELQNEIKKKDQEANNEAETSMNVDPSPNTQNEMLIKEWQNFAEIWNRNKEKVGAHKIYANFISFRSILVHPQFDGPLREFTPLNDFTYPQNGFSYCVKLDQIDRDNWWCIGSEEHNRKIDLTVYDGGYDRVEAYSNRVNIPYRQKFFFSSVQCFVGFLRGIGFRFMYVSTENK